MGRRVAACLLLAFLPTLSLQAQRGGGGGNPPLASLKTAALPQPTNLAQYVRDQSALIALGKALFWDMQTGSDGRTACASCHFHSGADHRTQNQLSGANIALNQTLTLDAFPFRKLANPNNNASAVFSDTAQVAGSAGIFERAFAGIEMGNPADLSAEVSHQLTFALGGVRLRQVTARNSPSVINAVFYPRNFWDGRASQLFTGATPFGNSDTALNAVSWDGAKLTAEPVRINNASLASQAVGPILNSVEMSFAGRTWEQLGNKMLSLAPLARQRVDPSDSVLGAYANPLGTGLLPNVTYSALIQAAFKPEYWSAPTDGATPSQLATNFALFWGLAIQAYESTLISGDSRVDRFFDGDTSALTALEQTGLRQFQAGDSQCINCHNGPEVSAATYTNLARQANNALTATAAGFFRIGVRPIAEDLGFGGVDGFNNPLFTGRGTVAQGTFKAPSLRNVELTGPYFHNGSQATLEQVLDFYGRNGDFPGDGNLGPGIGRIRLNPTEKTAIIAFLKALTDDRVKFQRAPFDHPSLCVPNGQIEASPGLLLIDPTLAGMVAQDRWALVPETGAAGLDVPLQTFEELLRGIGADGTRANTLTQSCTP